MPLQNAELKDINAELIK